jgi:hypothetical protein
MEGVYSIIIIITTTTTTNLRVTQNEKNFSFLRRDLHHGFSYVIIIIIIIIII